ncbi:MAG: LamG-like jellyroll fold domain-containing protein [Verrucomicrobiia bacterium]
MRNRLVALFSFFTLILSAAQSLMAQASMPVYTDNLVNSFQDWSYSCTRSFTSTSPVHSGSYAIAVTNASGGTLYLHSPDFNTSPYATISLWLNGGAAGGQVLRVYGLLDGAAQTAYTLSKLPTNSWQQFTVPLSSLGVANQTNFSGIWIKNASGGAQPVYYADDIQIGAGPAPALVHLNVDASQTIRIADPRWFGVNMATWDSYLGNATTLSLLKQAGFLATRLPGGSGADVYHWANNAGQNAVFYQNATNLGVNGQTIVTVNYGTGTPAEAAGWVLSANVTNHCNIKYWEIGNECYGTWETDSQAVPHDPYTYAVRAAQYMRLMRAADPTIKIGVVVSPGDTANINNMNHAATNSRTSAVVYGWTPVMLATLKSLGAQPDFLIHHVYPQYTFTPWTPPASSPDSDPLLLQAAANWAADAATLRQEISDYFGTGGTNIELCCTENNSDSSLGGKQLSSLVNGLYIADNIGRITQTEFNSYLWWDLRNGTGSNGDLDPTLYGWRNYGDEGVITGLNSLNPTYYSMKLLQYFLRPRDTVLQASSDYVLLSAYAALRSDGALNLLVINKDSLSNFTGQINLASFAPGTNATVHAYGITQDNATKNGLSAQLQDVATTTFASASNQFSYSFPPYSLTLFTFLPTNYITLALAMGAGLDWDTTTNWSDGNPASVSAAANPANVYDVLAGALLRSPVAGGATFPGNQLIVNGDGTWVSGGSTTISEFRAEASPVTVPWLQMNGGQFDVSGTGNSQSVLNGQMDILANTPFYNDPANDQGLTVNSFLTGAGNVEWRDSGFSLANGNTLNISGNTNTYTGTWNVVLGTLLGTGTNALGTNNITVGASGYLETTYDLNNTNATLALNGRLLLHQNDTFKYLVLGGAYLSAGTYSFAQLNAAYPAYFPASWTLQNGSSVSTGSGSLTVLSTLPPAIAVEPQPALAKLYPGKSIQYSVTVSGGQPFYYQWQAGVTGSGVYTNLVNGGNFSGATNATLTITNLVAGNAADYVVVITNSGGSITSSVATLVIVNPDGEAYQAAALATAPVAFYELNEPDNPATGAAVAYDYVGGNNGSYGSAVKNGFNNIAGPRLVPDGFTGFSNTNTAAYFTNNMANSQITLPPLNLNANTVTITAWLKPLGPQNNSAGIVFSRAGTTVAGLCYTGTQLNGNYTLGYNWNNESGAYSWNSGLVAPLGQWSFVALSVGPSSATLYLMNTNGIVSATHAYTHVVQNFDGITLIGDDSSDGGNGSRSFNGAIDDVAVFKSTLSLNQLKTLFSAGAAPVASFTGTPTTGLAPLSVTFIDASTGNITNRHWIFGDGNTLDTTAKSVPYTYNTAGTYSVTLVESGPGGQATNTLGNYITASSLVAPMITGITQSGSNITILGVGTPTASYGLLSWTNILMVTNGGIAVANGTFDPTSGTSTNTITLQPTNPAVFFRLKSPYP